MFTTIISLGYHSIAIAQPCKILIFGDSLSAAYGIPIEQGWVSLLKTRLNEKHHHCEVVNASISGETTAGGLTRLPNVLKQHQPTFMLLELGANDGLRGLPIASMQNNLQRIIHLAQEHKIQTLLIGMQIPPNYGLNYAQRFSQTFKTLAKDNQLSWVPFMLEGFALDPQLFLNDGIHPNAQAQPIILNTIWQQLEPMLKGK